MISESDYRSGRSRRRRRILLVSLPVRNPRSAADHGDGGPGAATASEEPVAKRTRSRSAVAPAIAVLPLDLLLGEILARLPSAAVLRCRAVCRSWRRLSSDPEFLLAHHRRQPSVPLFTLSTSYDHGGTTPAGPDRGQPLLAFDVDHRGRFTLHASCDGLLLISNGSRSFTICNPATRQHAPVPGLNAAAFGGGANIEALYAHHPSGEYRVLYWHDHYFRHKTHSVCYVLSLPRAREPRRVALPAAYLGMVGRVDPRPPPVMSRGCLHWGPNSYSSLAGTGAVAVFDTVAESFRSMRLPAAALAATSCCTLLHDMDGMLGLSCFDVNGKVAKVWVLDDYQREVWSLKYKINFSSESMCSLAKRHLVLSHEGDMLLYSNNSNSGSHMVHYDGKFLEKFQWESWASTLTGHLFKESLVNHAFFPKPCSAPTVKHRCLFTRL